MATPNDRSIAEFIDGGAESKVSAEEQHPLVQVLLQANRSADSLVEVFKKNPDDFLHENLLALLTNTKMTGGLDPIKLLYAYDFDLVLNSVTFEEYQAKVKYNAKDISELKAVYQSAMGVKAKIFKKYTPGCFSGPFGRRDMDRCFHLVASDMSLGTVQDYHRFNVNRSLINSFSENKLCFLDSIEFMRLKSKCVDLSGSAFVQGVFSGLGISEFLWEAELNRTGRRGIREVTASDAFVSSSPADHMDESSSENSKVERMTCRELADKGLKPGSTVYMVYPRVQAKKDMLYLIEQHVIKGPTGNEMAMLVVENLHGTCVNQDFFDQIDALGAHTIKIPLQGISIDLYSFSKSLGTGNFLILIVGKRNILYEMTKQELLEITGEIDNPAVCRQYSAAAVNCIQSMHFYASFPLIDLHAMRQTYLANQSDERFDRFCNLLFVLCTANAARTKPMLFDNTVIDTCEDLDEKFLKPCVTAWASEDNYKAYTEFKALLHAVREKGYEEPSVQQEAANARWQHAEAALGGESSMAPQLPLQAPSAPPILYQAENRNVVQPVLPQESNVVEQIQSPVVVPQGIAPLPGLYNN